GRGSRLKPLPPAPPDFAGLAAALGQALAGLAAFEAAHTVWNVPLKCLVWVTSGPPLPVRRLRPMTAQPALTPTEKRHAAATREAVRRHILHRYGAGYTAGYRDAAAGLPPADSGDNPPLRD
ncbi:MAG TPA: hypothetical protein VHZ56_07855, partial [Devosia sp.]|nr:hypothetical protein [Devosia sp.]